MKERFNNRMLFGRQIHPWCQQKEVVRYCQDSDIIIEAYSPLATGARLDDPVVESISTKHGKSHAQVLIRYSLQKGWIPLPKSSKPDRISENFNVFDFVLDADDMKALDELDQGSAGAVFKMNVD
jgi:diketogulonate reductase-like aldo/keto reductase